MNKKQAEELTNDVLIADALLRLKTLENLLISKGIFTKEEFDTATSEIASKIAKSILQKANVPGDLDALIQGLQGNKPKLPGN
jgi:TPP-dependent pyruvate/acetoin dehydrogenase alpha subunit